MPPARQYLSIRPYGRRYRIWDIAPCPCLSRVHTFPTPKFGYGIGRLHVDDVGCAPCPPPDPSEISPRQYLSTPFPNPKYRMWDLTPARQCLSIPCSRRYIGCGILPHVSIYLSPFPARNIGHGAYGVWHRVSF